MTTISIIGKTNTGKSTFFNKILNKKESIVTKKSNTTIRCIERQLNDLIIIDTPGIILDNKIKTKTINNLIYDSIKKSDIVIINIDEINLESEDFFSLDICKNKKKILTINKVDKLSEKEKILILIKKMSNYSYFDEIIPISNIKDINIEKIKNILVNLKIEKNLKKNIYQDDELHLKIKDIIRETLLDNLNKEIPYNLIINLSKELTENITSLEIELRFKKYNYKKIIIGHKSKNITNIKNIVKTKIKKLYKLDIKNIKINLKHDNKYRN